MVALSLALFLTIVTLLLADLLCSYLRRRWMRAEEVFWRPKLGLVYPPRAATCDNDALVATATTATHEALSSNPPFYYAHGVM
ncbi:hypothetical protein E2562_023438 [Oryza meyeriana var. granulata]|uniref:Secreted protein n=1 Tax=Oryza meyeriana var. granulata TaxID=110450 RepID=A0A6G1FB69_9ORYZ|nr:hypothetical protein E2562_023438 [Oryza meyeriana var. granulata]